MGSNVNPHVKELLSWHGHAGAGVHVPFQPRSNPLGRTIPTALVERLRRLAKDIASTSNPHPRWIFLVGGPGNGKSETVQDFLTQLDRELGLQGSLRRILEQKFSPTRLLPRKVEVNQGDLPSEATLFTSRVGRLIVVQDATATLDALGNAAIELSHDVADLLTYPNDPAPVFVACANRGLLARAMKEAYREFGESDVTKIIRSVVQASSLGREVLSGQKPCWPIAEDSRFACWPLDVESLLVGDGATSPLEEILQQAVEGAEWEVEGRCLDCTSRDLCPFRQNAEWLRDNSTRRNLLSLLRRAELWRGQHWNFRDAYSLSAELLIGQWSDFEQATHPCLWVHGKTASASIQIDEAYALFARLYPNAIFRDGHFKKAATTFYESRKPDAGSHPRTAQLLKALTASGVTTCTTSIREMLAQDYADLDPANETPASPSHVLRGIEDAFCLTAEQGNFAVSQAIPVSALEGIFLNFFHEAETEWDLLARESATASAASCLLRKLASMLGKRMAGTRLGYHAYDQLLTSYEASLHDVEELAKVRGALLPLLANQGFSFNLVEVIGQPTAEGEPLFNLRGLAPGVQLIPAPLPTASAPGNDVPCIEITDPGYRIPLTFDFYMALQLLKAGCAGSSLPASVRAALDRVRHRYAGVLCREEASFVNGRTSIFVGQEKKIGITSIGSRPSLSEA